MIQKPHKNRAQEILYEIGKKSIDAKHGRNTADIARKPHEVRIRGLVKVAGITALTLASARGAVGFQDDAASLVRSVGNGTANVTSAMGRGIGDYWDSHTNTSAEQTAKDLARTDELLKEESDNVFPYHVKAGETASGIADRYVNNDQDKYDRLKNLIEAQHPDTVRAGEIDNIPTFLTNVQPDDQES